MKVLHLHFGKDGGAERFFVALVGAFGRRDVEQRFVIRPNRGWRGEIESLGPIVESNYRRRSILSWLLERRVRRMCDDWRPDAIMAWMPRAAQLIPARADAVKLARLGDFPDDLGRFGTCDVLVGNVPAIGDHCRDLGWTKPVVTISNFARPVTPMPVDRATFDTPADAFLVCGVGRFVHRKGMDLLIRAAARVPGAWLWLVGDGRERAALEALAAEVGIAERTRFLGWQPEPIHLIAAADVLGLPSRHEPFGNVAIEGWQAGVPVVSTRSEGPGWYMTDGADGCLVEIDDETGFAAALELCRDRDFAARLVAGGRATLEARFGEEAIARDYLRLFSGDLTDPMARG